MSLSLTTKLARKGGFCQALFWGRTTYRMTLVTPTCRRCMSIRLDNPKRSSFSENGYILLVIPITTFCLGAWQVKRRRWKLDLIAELKERTHALPVPFPINSLEDFKNLEYHRVIVKGTFDHSKEAYVGPRSLLKPEGDRQGGLMTKGGNTGFYVITPFSVADSDLKVMVNRGWVPYDKVDPKKRSKGQVTDEQEFIAVVRHTEKRPPFGAKNELDSNRFHHRDVEAIADYLGTLPICLDAGRDSGGKFVMHVHPHCWMEKPLNGPIRIDFTKSTVEGGPVGGQTRVTLRNEHASYIFTWYSLCAATLYMWYTRYGKRLFTR